MGKFKTEFKRGQEKTVLLGDNVSILYALKLRVPDYDETKATYILDHVVKLSSPNTHIS